MRKIYLALVLGLMTSAANAQISAPDTVCKGSTINYTTTADAESYAWAADNVDISPSGLSLSLSKSLKAYGLPAGVCMKLYNGNYYAFVSIKTGGLLRLDYGSNPFAGCAINNFGTFSGTLGDGTRGIDIVNDNGTYYGIMSSNNKLVRLNFGTSLTNTPTASFVTITGSGQALSAPQQLSMIKSGGEWLAFVTNSGSNSVTRFNFGSSLSSGSCTFDLILNTFPNYNFNTPVGFAIQNFNGNYIMLVADNQGGGPMGPGRLSTLNFHSSLKSIPSNSDYGSIPAGTLIKNPKAVIMVQDCDQFYALITNDNNNNKLIQVTFTGDMVDGATGNSTFTDLGNLAVPGALIGFTSSYWYNNQLCVVSSSSSDSAIYMYQNIYTLPASGTFSYANTGFTNTTTGFGTYPATLHVNQGKAIGNTAYCKDVYAIDNININIRQYDTIFVAKGARCDNYVWQKNGVVIPGAVTDTLRGLTDSAIYTVIGYKAGCTSFSTVRYYFSASGISTLSGNANVNIYPNPSTGLFNIKAEDLEADNITISCYNMIGSMVNTTNVKTINGNLSTTVDLSGLPAGLYQVKLQSDKGSYIKQVVLQ